MIDERYIHTMVQTLIRINDNMEEINKSLMCINQTIYNATYHNMKINAKLMKK